MKNLFKRCSIALALVAAVALSPIVEAASRSSGGSRSSSSSSRSSSSSSRSSGSSSGSWGSSSKSTPAPSKSSSSSSSWGSSSKPSAPATTTKPSSSWGSSTKAPVSATTPSSSSFANSTKSSATPARSSVDSAAYQKAVQNGTAYKSKSEAQTAFVSKNADKYPTRFASEPKARPSYVPTTTVVNGQSHTVVYNSSYGGYGYYGAGGIWYHYSPLSDAIMLSALMSHSGYHYPVYTGGGTTVVSNGMSGFGIFMAVLIVLGVATIIIFSIGRTY
jgi:hypothetical protein